MMTLKKLQQKYGPNWGLDTGERKAKQAKPAPTKEELAEHYKRHYLEFKPRSDQAAE